MRRDDDYDNDDEVSKLVSKPVSDVQPDTYRKVSTTPTVNGLYSNVDVRGFFPLLALAI
jgi:hypothetical protein